MRFHVRQNQYLLLVIGVASAVSFGYLLWRNICIRCVNFSCPLNGVDPATRQAFFDRNPMIAQAWKMSGYHLDQKKGD